MMQETVHPVEDAFHRLQTPMPAPPDGVPTDAELVDAASIELWNAGFTRREVAVVVSDKGLRLSGVVPSEAAHAKALKAVRKAAGGRGVVDEVVVAHQDSRVAEVAGSSALPAVFVTRYCGLEPASIAAGIRSTLSGLDTFLTERGVTGSSDRVLVYRNMLGDNVTIDVGQAVPDAVSGAANGEVRAGIFPHDVSLSLPILGGGHGLAAALKSLAATALRRGLAEPAYFWQALPDPHDPWPAEVPATLYAAWE